MESALEKWSGSVAEISIGATKDEGGTRASSIKLGGQKTLSLLFKEGAIPNKPVIAYEVWDVVPSEWPEELTKVYSDKLKDPVSWAQFCAEEYKAKVLCIRLMGAHPDLGNKTPDQEAKLIAEILKTVDVPLVILGSGDDAKDNLVLPAACQAAKGERALIGDAVQDNYKTLVAAVLADGHNIIAESPIDINIAKQLNILISDMGLALERIVINPTIGALGYGLEYAYSIMERARLAALSGDKTVANPFVCFAGHEAWRAKEAKAKLTEFPEWGPEAERGVIWEAATATALIQVGADLLIMRHPKAVERVNKYIEEVFEK